MRITRLAAAVAAALAIVIAYGAAVAQAPDQAPPPKSYKPVAITLPEPVKDPTFAAFRKQLAGIAQKKDRNALAKLVAKNFFWIPADKDVADKSKPPIEKSVDRDRTGRARFRGLGRARDLRRRADRRSRSRAQGRGLCAGRS